MILFEFTNEEKNRLQRLNNDKIAIFALKKLFINAVSERPASHEVNFLAAQRIAINILYDVFRDLSVIKPDIKTESKEGNLV